MLFEYFNNEASLLLNYDNKRCEYLLNKQSKLLHYEAVKPPAPAKNALPNSIAMQKHFNAFIAKLSITNGKRGVPWFVLYDVYRNYCIDIGFKVPKIFRTFNDYMRFHFKYVNNFNGPVFLIDIQPGVLPKKSDYAKIEKKYQLSDKKKSL